MFCELFLGSFMIELYRYNVHGKKFYAFEEGGTLSDKSRPSLKSVGFLVIEGTALIQ